MSASIQMGCTREALHAALLASHSATLVLERFFGPITADRHDEPASRNDGLEERLRLLPGDVLRHRAVRLLAGAHVVSNAELWYVANRLPPDRVALLESSTAPFGRIMRPLALQRQVLLARICAPNEPASLEHRALLTTHAGLPVAEVQELYAVGIFGEP